METAKDLSIVTLLIPFSIVLFIIAMGVILLYQSFQKKLYIKELYNASIKAKQQLALLENTVTVQESERKRIASDLHDELGAIISMMKMNLLYILQKEKKNKKDPDPQTMDAMQNLTRLAETGLNTVRHLSHQLMPPQLAAFGLIRTLNSFTDTISQSGNIRISLEAPDQLPELEWMTTLGLYRVIMELINNTLKHARADKITIEIGIDDELLHLTYWDNGIGLPAGKPPQTGMGLLNIEARIHILKGTFNILCDPGQQGFNAVITIPFK
ncbi:hypothetical protein FAM09_28260 [Niastella caeni]|uniref:histidine kinase n=1 Tax=Niastella caeni TaxID=2569763 RepID=A0A4S8HBB7_9BACT|nr:histidine kinase [Niastella caeni]THU31521.1 hypothetical protein FAM09_28260 [Niastella caeni]